MRESSAFTLIELVVVIAILVALAGVMVPLFTDLIHTANATATEHTLTQLRDSLAQYWSDTKHLTLDGVTTVATNSNRMNLEWLFANPVTGDSTFGFDPQTQLGWRGPYLTQPTGSVTPGATSMIDAWNEVIVVHDVDPVASLRDVRLVSGGPNGVIEIPSGVATDALTAGDLGDDIYVAVFLR